MIESRINSLIFTTETCLCHQNASAKHSRGAQGNYSLADGRWRRRLGVHQHTFTLEMHIFAEGKVKMFIHSSLESCHSADEECYHRLFHVNQSLRLWFKNDVIRSEADSCQIDRKRYYNMFARLAKTLGDFVSNQAWCHTHTHTHTSEKNQG